MASPERATAPGRALVTGGSGGLGRAICLHLARDGFEVTLTYRKNRATALRTVKQLQQLGVRAEAIQVDLSRLEEVEALAQRLAAGEVTTRVLVNCAAELFRGDLEKTGEADLVRSFVSNCAAAFGLARRLAPAMRAAGGGSIVNVSSVLGVSAGQDRSAYTTSKAALIGLTRALAVELAPSVRVNAVVPGLFATEMNARLRDDAALRAETFRRIPLGRLGEPEECAAVIGFLAGAGSSYVTGAVWEVDGGVLARLALPVADPK